MTENVSAARDQTVSARTAHPQLHRGGYFRRAAVHKALITKMNAHLRVQWCKKPLTLVHRDLEKCDVVTRIFLHRVLNKWEQHRRDYLTLTGRWIRWLCRHGSGPLVPLVGKVTANQYRDILSHSLYPVMEHLYGDGSGLFQDDSASIHWSLGVNEWLDEYENNGLRSHQIHLSMCERFWSHVLHSSLQKHHPNIPEEFSGRVKSTPWCSEAVTWPTKDGYIY